MPRWILDEQELHPAIRARVADSHRDIVDEVRQAVARHAVVVVGMRGNPFVRKARRVLAQAGVDAHYLGYGGYLSDWRRRNALKMWSGWPTFPLVFVGGQLIGGCEDLRRLVDSGELAQRVSAAARGPAGGGRTSG